MQVAPKTAKADVGGARQGVATATGAVAQSGVAVADPALEELDHGAVVIAAITSCTNTSNPSVMIGAGLVAKKAVERGLTRKPWVKSSLAPGSKVVTEYLDAAGLSTYLNQLGFDLVGYGCTTCIGNSGPLPDEVSAVIREKNLVVCSVLSGNRNFEGRIQQDVRANYLASPPLVVAYALAGWITKDLTTEPLGEDRFGKPVFLKDIWPTEQEIQETMQRAVTADMFKRSYSDVFKGDERWQQLPVPEGNRYAWDDVDLHPQADVPRGHDDDAAAPVELTGVRVLALLGDSVTTDHISPAGSIKADSPAGKYLIEHGVKPSDFNSYGARRGNHEVMVRGTFANTRLRNQLAPGTEGGWTNVPAGRRAHVDLRRVGSATARAGVPLMVIAGKEYGSGSSRDWAAKGTFLLGVKVVIAESFERIHRSNLVNMGVLPLQFKARRHRGVAEADRDRGVQPGRRGCGAEAARRGACAGEGRRRERARSSRSRRASTRRRSWSRSGTAASCRTSSGSSYRGVGPDSRLSAEGSKWWQC